MMGSEAKSPGVLILNGCLPPPYGGIAKYLSATLPMLAAKGFRIWAVMPRNYSENEYLEYRVKGINVFMPRGDRHMSFPQVVKLTVKLAVRYLPWLWRRCVRYRLPLREALRILHSWLPECDALLEEHGQDVDIIHVYDAPWAQGWIGQILAEKHSKILMMTTYGEVVPHNDPIQPIDELSYKYKDFCAEVISNCYRISSPTIYCASKLAFVGVNPQEVFLTCHVSGMDKFIHPLNSTVSLVEKYPVLEGKRLILFVGQMQKRKGPDLLLRVSGNILKEYPDCVFAFVGPDYGMLNELKEMAQQLGVSKSCLFTGGVPEEELYRFYHQAEMFVFTTISKIECLGLTFVQAMYAKCPVVASNISGVPEVIRHGENGLLFDPGDEEQMKQCILELSGDQTLRRRIAEQAFLDVTSQFQEQLSLEHVKKFYKT